MLYIHIFAVLGVFAMCFCFCEAGIRRGELARGRLSSLLLAAVLIRVIAAALSHGFGNDTACFASWADRIFQVGPSGFYSPDFFTDYPPGYMYVLWVLGAVRKLFGIEYYSAPHLVLLKIPAIICDMACGLLLYREATKKCSENQSFFLCAAYLLNPAVILNSSVWGQVDSVFTLAVVYMCLCLIQGRMYPAYIAFGIGVLIKPQTLIFGPIILAGFIDHVSSLRAFARNALQCVSVALAGIILCLPFGLENVFKQYFTTVGSYPYAAINAYNFWGFLGLNWVSQDNTFLGIPYQAYGMAAIVLTVVFVLFLSFRNRGDNEKYPFLAALLILSIFMFSVRMHERYMYPGLLLLLLSYVYKPSGLTFLCYGSFSVMHFYNTAHILFFYDPKNYSAKTPFLLLVSAGMLACTGLLYYITYRLYRGQGACTVTWEETSVPEGQASDGLFRITGAAPSPSRKRVSLKKADILCMIVITAVYSVFALRDLGDRVAPSTSYDMSQGQSIELDFGDSVPTLLSYYIAPWHGRVFSLEGKNNPADSWTVYENITLNNVFSWQDAALNSGTPLIKLTLQEPTASLIELVFLDDARNVITPVNAGDYPNLFDESNLYPETATFRNGMYFDEIYHGRTAYEFLHGLTTYENTHPPLGKILISLGVAVFGMNPFGWRIVGTLFGIFMVPLIYLFARQISKNTATAALACILFTFDFMHFSQTRIATIDVYITFFVILMYYFMYRYCCLSFYDTALKKTWLPLGACGICMGLGIAAKWTGVYAGCGLAVIFFSLLYRRYREYLYAKEDLSGCTNGISHRHVAENFVPYTKRTICFCVIFFVVLPGLIYLLSYLPFRDYSDRGLIGRMLYNQQTMFDYHSNLESTHIFSSYWYEWPVVKRPIWYYSRIVTGQQDAGGIREGISSFGNPAVWWAGIPAFLYTIYLWAKKKDKTAAFLVVGYMAQYLPWMFVTRSTFIYHYFPSVVFVVLMIMYSFRQLQEKVSRRAFLGFAVVYGAVVVALFLLFYPVLSGQPVEAAYVQKYLRWFSSWVLTAK